MLSRFLNLQTKNINISALFLAGSALLSAVLGWFRDNLLATILPKAQADTYLAAFRLPDFLYAVVVAGGLVAAFLPVFSEHFARSKKESQELLSNIFCFFVSVLVFCAFLLLIFAPWLVNVIVPGFDANQKNDTVLLVRIMSLSPLLLGVSGIFAAVLQYFNVFLAIALAPIFYNVGIIVGILFFRLVWGLPGVAVGVILGAALHLLVQFIPAVKLGFKPKFLLNISHQGLQKILKLMAPRVFSASAMQFNLLFVTFLASALPAGSILIFNLANNLQGIALSFIGIPLAIVAFPVLSRQYVNRDQYSFSRSFSLFFLRILFLVIPVSVLLFFFRNQIVRLLYTSFFHGNGLSAFDSQLVSSALGIFAFSIFAACLAPFLSRAFFAFHNTKTPVGISLLAMALNIFCSYLFVNAFSGASYWHNLVLKVFNFQSTGSFAVLGLPLAFTISNIVQCFLMIFFLRKKIKPAKSEFTIPLVRILFASLVMVIFVLLFLYSSHGMSADKVSILDQFVRLSLALLLSVVVYFLAALVLGCKEAKGLYGLVISRFNKHAS